MALKPTALIISGASPTALSPATSLLPLLSDACRHVRIVDKYLIIVKDPSEGPGLYTAWFPPSSRRLLEAGTLMEKGRIEYCQVNLQTEAGRAPIFVLNSNFRDPNGPEQQSYDWVFDFSGDESTLGGVEWNADLFISRTVLTARSLARLAMKAQPGGPKVYVRPLTSFYKSVKSKNTPISERGEDSKVWGLQGVWAHEAARGLASIDGLRLAVVRPGVLYGPYIAGGFTRRLIMGEIYKYEGEKLEFLWDEDLRQHTIHTEDYAQALLQIAQYYTEKCAGGVPDDLKEALVPCRKRAEDKEVVDPEGKFPAKDETLRAAVFNVVDDGDTTQRRMAELIGKTIGVKVGFHGTIVSQFAKLNMDEVLEEANDRHFAPWPEMLLKSNPPIPNTPLTPNVHKELLSPEGCALDNSKIKRVIGWSPKHPRMEEAEVTRILTGFKEEQIWPNVPPKKK